MAQKKEAGTKEAILGFVVIIIIIGLIVWAITGIVHHISHHNATHATKTVQAASTTAKKPVTSTKQPAQAESNAQQVTDWFNKYSYILDIYTGDFSTINTDAGNNDITGVAADCEQLNTDVKTAQALPAIPNAQAASDFSEALTYYQTGAEQCVTAANNDDNDGLVAAAGLFTKGNSAIATTKTDIEAAKQ